MRKLIVLAAALACAGAGLLAGGRLVDDAQAAKPQSKTESKDKTIVVERHGDGDGPRVFAWEGTGPAYGVRIGVRVANLDEEQAKTMTGVVVTDVSENGPAAKAGVHEKDVITEFDGEKVRSAAQLSRLVGETAPGRTVTLAAMREGTRVEMRVTPEADELALAGRMHGFDPFTPDRMPRLHPGMPLAPEQRQFRFELPKEPGTWEFRGPEGQFRFRTPGEGDGDSFNLFVPGRGRLGIGIQDLTDQLAEYFGTKDGVLVSSVTQDSPAAKAGLRAGDVITSIDDKPVTSAEQLIAAVRDAGDGATLKVGYVRDRKPGTASATLEPRERPKRPTRPA